MITRIRQKNADSKTDDVTDVGTGPLSQRIRN